MKNTTTQPDSAVPMDNIIQALNRLGYPQQGVKDAALRMSWVPELAKDMIAYTEEGAPKPDSIRGIASPFLLRPLNNGFNVALLMDGYLLEATGAFLMGAALITHNDEALGMLEKMVEQGVTQRTSDGSYRRMQVPAAQHYPQCPVCGARWFRNHPVCPVCGIPANKL